MYVIPLFLCLNLNNKMQNKTPQKPSFFNFFIYWLKLGFISFGGPAGQISMMHQELVEKRRWISQHRFLHALNYTMVLPGPEAQQLATYIGWLMFGVWGGLIAGFLFVLPSLFILSALSWVYLSYGDVGAIAGILYGIKPAITAIVVFAAYRIGSRVLSNNVLRILAVLAFAAIFFFNIAFPYIVLMAGTIGFLGAKFYPNIFKMSGHDDDNQSHYGAALIDDDTPIPQHAQFKWTRILSFLAVGLTLGFLVFAFLPNGVLSDMAQFFTKAALVTFGGAYAVLPYVYQGGVEQYFWLTGTQMIDGLALGETTPGPLIMVVAFVGFVGAWTHQIFGVESLLLAGFAGALVATFFTFLPSFLFIFLGGPGVEATRGNLTFSAPLSAVTASVVGVILNLAVFFATASLWQSATNTLDWVGLFIALSAAIALFKFNLNIMLVIAFSAVIGLGVSIF
jgi:chromate transporter